MPFHAPPALPRAERARSGASREAQSAMPDITPLIRHFIAAAADHAFIPATFFASHFHAGCRRCHFRHDADAALLAAALPFIIFAIAAILLALPLMLPPCFLLLPPFMAFSLADCHTPFSATPLNAAIERH